MDSINFALALLTGSGRQTPSGQVSSGLDEVSRRSDRTEVKLNQNEAETRQVSQTLLQNNCNTQWANQYNQGWAMTINKLFQMLGRKNQNLNQLETTESHIHMDNWLDQV
jgi:hypothetical protein